MTDIERDEIFFRNKKGRYAPGGLYEHATRPMEAAAGMSVQETAKAALADSFHSRPLGMNWGNASQFPADNVEQVEPIEKVDAVGYTPISMRRDPFITGYKNDTPDDTPVMSAAAVADLPDFAPAVMIRID